MKFIKFQSEEGPRYGVVEKNEVREIIGDIFKDWSFSQKTMALENLKILPPVEPQKVIAIGLNYVSHAKEKEREIPQDPMMFMVSATAIITDQDQIIIPFPEHLTEYEAELVVVMGKTARSVSEETALDYVFGYTIGNDISDRDLQRKDKQFTRAKSFHTFKPLGPVIETQLDPGNVDIKLWVNGELKQNSNTKYLIHSIPKLISFISEVMTLYPGDLIYTGTPEGVGPLKSGDKMEIRIQGIGALTNTVS